MLEAEAGYRYTFAWPALSGHNDNRTPARRQPYELERIESGVKHATHRPPAIQKKAGCQIQLPAYSTRASTSPHKRNSGHNQNDSDFWRNTIGPHMHFRLYVRSEEMPADLTAWHACCTEFTVYTSPSTDSIPRCHLITPTARDIMRR